MTGGQSCNVGWAIVMVGATERMDERALGFAVFRLPAQESFLDS